MDNIEQAAILLLGMGEEHAAEVLKHMDQKQVEKIVASMRKLNDVSEKDIITSLSNFLTMSSNHTGLGSNAQQYIRNTLL